MAYPDPVFTAVGSDGLHRGTPSAFGVDSARIMAFLDDVEQAGLELHGLMLWRDGAVVAEGWHWPYRADRLRMTHSMTKSVTACAIGLLVDERKLHFDDRVCGFFPEVDIDADSPASRMTVEDLLTMRAGHAEEVSGSIWRGLRTSWVEEFFRIPIVHEPGTTYVYSSAASYMLSAIVTRVTGETIDAFLAPRLFAPLGIVEYHWDLGPDGINPGGNGISFRPPDSLKLGILHAQGGMWQGRRLLPEWWVDAATRAQGSPGYGYHWVVGEHYFIALGVFVQLAAAYPAAGAVLTIHAAMDHSKVLLPHLNRHFPAAFAGGSPAADVQLQDRLRGWRAPPRFASTAHGAMAELTRGRWAVADNPVGVTGLSFDDVDDDLTLAITDGNGEHSVRARADDWLESRTSLPGASLHHGYAMADTPTVAGFRWLAANQLELVLHFAESAFRDTLTFTFDGDRLTMERSVNINSGDRAWPTLSAVRESEPVRDHPGAAAA